MKKNNFDAEKFFAGNDLAAKAYKKAKAEGQEDVVAIEFALYEAISFGDDDDTEGAGQYVWEAARQVLNGSYDNIKDVQEEIDIIEEEERKEKE